MTVPARALFAVVRAYQYVTAGRVSPCRYIPSCSNYALDAFERHGALRGGWLVARRLGRCHPWGRQGWDPVPDRVDRGACDHSGHVAAEPHERKAS